MKRVLLIVSHPNEIPIAKRRINECKKSKTQCMLVSTSPQTNMALLQQDVPFQDIGTFYPTPEKSFALQKKLLKFVTSWHNDPLMKDGLMIDGVNIGKAAMFGLHMHLGEIGHSILTAERLISIIHPNAMYGSTNHRSFPFRRYDDEFLSYEGWAIELVATQKHIPFSRIGKSLSYWPSCAWALFCHFGSIIKNIGRLKTTPRISSQPITFLGNYYQLINLLPTLEECQKRRLSFLTIGKATPKQRSELAKKGIPFVSLPGLIMNDGSHTLRVTLHFLRVWFVTKSSLQKTCDSINPLLWTMLKPKIFWYFLVEFPELAALSKSVTPLFAPPAKTLVTMATSDHVSRTIALTAQKENVRVIELQHGFYLLDFEYFLRSNDYFLLWNAGVRSILRGAKEAPHRYPIASYPWFDQYQSSDKAALRKIGLKNIQPPADAAVMLMLANMPNDLDDDRLTLTSSPYQYASMIFSALAKKTKTWYVIFRPHPSCASDWVIKLAAHYDIPFYYDNRSIPLSEVIAASDVVVANFTTALLDTMFLKKPILLHTFRNGVAADIDRFAQNYGVPWKRFATQKEFSQLLELYCTDMKKRNTMIRSQQKLLRAQIFFQQTSSANEITEHIIRLSREV